MVPNYNVKECKVSTKNSSPENVQISQQKRKPVFDSAQNYANIPVATGSNRRSYIEDVNNNSICSINTLLDQGVVKEWNVWENDLELDIFKSTKVQEQKVSWAEECENLESYYCKQTYSKSCMKTVRRALYTEEVATTSCNLVYNSDKK